MATLDEQARAALKKNQQDAIKLAQDKGLAGTRALLARAQKDLEKRLRVAEGLSGPGRDSFTAKQLRATLAQVRMVTIGLTRGLRPLLLDGSRGVAENAARVQIAYLKQIDRLFRGAGVQPLSLNEARMFDRSVKGAEASILRRLASTGKPATATTPAEPEHPAKAGILARYGERTLASFEDALQKALITRKPWEDIRKDIIEKSPFLKAAPAHWAERIVRTEIAGAHNRASWEASREADEQLGDVVKIISSPMDDRTGADSMDIHGQIRRVDEAFESWYGAFQHPPDRPNDRAVVVTHRISWPIPPNLKPVPREKVLARWRLEGRKGPIPPRPNMTTVPLNQFGRRKAPRPPRDR